jgi:hypothetical protein
MLSSSVLSPLNWRTTCSKREMNVVGKEGEGVTTRFPLTQHARQTFNKSIPVDIKMTKE